MIHPSKVIQMDKAEAYELIFNVVDQSINLIDIRDANGTYLKKVVIWRALNVLRSNQNCDTCDVKLTSKHEKKEAIGSRNES